ncbi:MAG: restriction endonuclease subunit M [Ruminococcaceae bacterium]|nr:restriction endonuclease subunit M [Oscillospiraceae bacterium]
MKNGIDIDEQKLIDINPKLLDVLLIDRTSGQNIIWGTEDYIDLGYSYNSHYPITAELISGKNSGVIKPRVVKSKELQGDRTKEKAEVFTPSWLCNEQNNLIDEAWFGRKEVFNISGDKSWKTVKGKIEFPEEKGKSWKDYVDERRLEITCGEAPYLVSRYDTTTGEFIKVNNRIGLLDRKMRIVSENTETEEEWLKWSERAFQSIYGFEFQGDSLLLARENLLYSYVDYMKNHIEREPTEKELMTIAKIISWNIWQMDGLTMTIPYKKVVEQFEQISLFEEENEEKEISYCKIRDWRSKKDIEFFKLTEGEVGQ